MQGSMPVTATLTPVGENDQYLVSLLWQYKDQDNQMIRNHVFDDSMTRNMVNAIDVVVQAQSGEDFTMYETPHFYEGIDCNGGKRVHLFYAKTTGQVYLATRVLVTDVYASKNDASWFNFSRSHCKINGHWNSEFIDRNTGYYHRDINNSSLRIANGLNNITDVAAVFSREISSHHRHQVYVAANGKVKVYKVLEKGIPTQTNPHKEVQGVVTFNNWGNVDRLDSFKSDLHWRVYTAYTQKDDGELCLAKTPIWDVTAEPVVIRCLTLEGNPILAGDVSITGK